MNIKKHLRMFENCSEPLRTNKSASEYLQKPKNTPQRQRMPQILQKSYKTNENSSERLRTCQNGRECHSKTVQNQSKLTKLLQKASQHPLNERERLWTFRNNWIRLKIYENTNVNLRRPHIVREQIRTFRNLSEQLKKRIKTFQNASEHPRMSNKASEYPGSFQNHEKVQITPEHQRITVAEKGHSELYVCNSYVSKIYISKYLHFQNDDF